MKEKFISCKKHYFRVCNLLWIISFMVPMLSPPALLGQGGPTTLPVYEIVQSGAPAAQAAALANALNIPQDQLVQSNGMVTYVDPTKFLAIPTTPVTNSMITSNILALTKNLYPTLPITFETIDFAGLSNRVVLDTNNAINLFSNALVVSALYPQSGVPEVGHTTFTVIYTNTSGITISNSQYLDTDVTFQFADTNGIPFIGPGTQVQVSYAGDGSVTRLLYAARQMVAGPLVDLIPSDVASNRLAAMFPPGATIGNLQLTYWCPSFEMPYTGPQPVPWAPATVIPWFRCTGLMNYTNPDNGMVYPIHLKCRMIPATDDGAYVPTVNLSVSSIGGTQVVASASVTGGSEYYWYLWSGSDPAASTNTQSRISYTPMTRIAPPPLAVTTLATGGRQVSWPYPSTGFVLMSSTDLTANVWSPVTNSVQNDGNQNMTTPSIPGSRTIYYRLDSTIDTLEGFDTVGVTVIDQNGIIQNAHQSIPIIRQPVPRTGVPAIPSIGYGTESPREPDFAIERIGWQTGMGVPQLGGGQEVFCWTGDKAWPGDFIEPQPPGFLPALPWVNGDADYLNWGVNSAVIVLNDTDGASDFFCESQPGATIGQYFTSGLARPKNPGWTVVINLLNGKNTAQTKAYNIDYDYSWGPFKAPTGGTNVTDDSLIWLCQDCPDVLDLIDGSGYATARWQSAFGGLHMMTGFASGEAVGDGSFENNFALNMLSPSHPQTVVESWLNAAMAAGIKEHGVPAAMGPIGPANISDYTDHYWGKGSVNGNIRVADITGWWYVIHQ
jgi:hypothetical protein